MVKKKEVKKKNKSGDWTQKEKIDILKAVEKEISCGGNKPKSFPEGQGVVVIANRKDKDSTAIMCMFNCNSAGMANMIEHLESVADRLKKQHPKCAAMIGLRKITKMIEGCK